MLDDLGKKAFYSAGKKKYATIEIVDNMMIACMKMCHFFIFYIQIRF